MKQLVIPHADSKVKACCKVVENLEPVETDRDDLAMARCTVCGCRHFEAQADAGVLGMIGTTLR